MRCFLRRRHPTGPWRALGVSVLWCAVTAAGPARAGLDNWAAQMRVLADDPDVIACYDFQAGQGNVLANNARTGRPLDGVIKDAEWADGRWPGKRALRFNGVDSRVEVPASSLLFPLDASDGGFGELTIEAWIQAASTQESGIVDKSSNGSGSAAPYMLWISPNRLAGLLGDGKICAHIVDLDPIETGTWTHVAMTADATTLRLYRDGIEVARGDRGVAPADNGEPLLIGTMGNARYFFHGLIDELVLYRKALTATDIRARAANGPVVPICDTVIELAEPVGGERWAAGSPHVVRWTGGSRDPERLVTLEVSLDDGRHWSELATLPSQAGGFTWTVPDSDSTRAKMRVRDLQRETSSESERPFAIAPSQAVADYEWIRVAKAGPFAPRDGCGVLAFHDRLWLLGGWNPADKAHFPRTCNNEVWSSEDGAAWTLVKPNTFLDATFDPASDWEGRHTAGYVVFNDRMWILGGDPLQGHYQDDIWNSADGRTWTRVLEKAPWGPRVLHHTVAFAGRIWVMGGQTLPPFAPAEERFYSDTWSSEDGVEWTPVESRKPHWAARGMIGGHAVFRGRMWILGGGTYDTPRQPRRKMYNDVWSTADGVTWQCHVVQAPWAPRQYHDVAVFDDRLWVCEGYSGQNRSDVWYSADGTNWYELPQTPWSPRHAAGVAVHDNALWMIMGNNMEPDVWKLVRRQGAGEHVNPGP